MIYYLYQITNLINNKIYVGVHRTENLDDGYMGSGKHLKASQEKYGIENFRKDILEYFESSDAMFLREAEIVTPDFLQRPDVYNLRVGGFGGFDHINSNAEKFLEAKHRGWATRQQLYMKKFRENPEFASAMRELAREHMLESGKKSHTPEANAKRQESYKDIQHQQGSKNSQYGKMWITDETESRSVSKNETIPEGWRKGRVIRARQVSTK